MITLKWKFTLLLTLVLFSMGTRSKAQLSAGDIAIIGFNSDTSPDKMALVTLVEIPSGQVIYTQMKLI